MLDRIEALLDGWRVHRSGDVPNQPAYPYLLLYSLQPVPVRSMARPENARRYRFGVSVVDLGSQHVEADADAVEALLEGSRGVHAASRIELVARGPSTRDPEVTVNGQEIHVLPLHFTVTIPKEPA